uniref:DDE_3 domain-containing protein n=1 Tax=Strongyloides stercoralis TaxID=6248 RepID=A0A0K0DZX4_STRER
MGIEKELKKKNKLYENTFTFSDSNIEEVAEYTNENVEEKTDYECIDVISDEGTEYCNDITKEEPEYYNDNIDLVTEYIKDKHSTAAFSEIKATSLLNEKNKSISNLIESSISTELSTPTISNSNTNLTMEQYINRESIPSDNKDSVENEIPLITPKSLNDINKINRNIDDLYISGKSGNSQNKEIIDKKSYPEIGTNVFIHKMNDRSTEDISIIMPNHKFELSSIRHNVHLFLTTGESYSNAKRQFGTLNGLKVEFPSFPTLKKWLKNLFDTGSVQGKPKVKPAAKLEVAIAEVKEKIKEDSRLSTRCLSALTTTPITTVWRALKANNLKSYKMMSVQQLLPVDHQKRRQFFLDELERITKDSRHLERIIFSDEAHFHLNGGINRHNCRMWSVDNPLWFEERSLHSLRVTVWGAISSSKIYGSYFFEGNESGQSYLDLLKSQVLQDIVKKHSPGEFIFMQDGAPPHYSKKMREWLDSNLNGCQMGYGSKNLA